MKVNTVKMLLVAIVLLHFSGAQAAEKQLTILVTTFPLYQITRNIAKNVPGVDIELMIPAQMGCPHDYSLTPQDMRKLGRADLLIVNGLGLEEFLGAPVKKANPKLKVIDSSKGINQVLQYVDGEAKAAGLEPQQTREGTKGNERRAHQDDDPGHGHGPNPHLFASPRMAALLASNIGKALAALHPEGAPAYTANAATYSQQMNQLADSFVDLGKRLKNNRIVTQHGVFDYLARDMGLKVVAVVQAHAGQQPSAAEMLQITQAIKKNDAGAVFTEPQYPEAVGAAIAREAGIVAARLDPAANGPEQAPLDYYQQTMRTNLVTLEQTLGRN